MVFGGLAAGAASVSVATPEGAGHSSVRNLDLPVYGSVGSALSRPAAPARYALSDAIA
jgi:hypothetical protein